MASQLALRCWPNVGIVAIGSGRRANVGIPSPALLQYVGILSERNGWHNVVGRRFLSGHR